MVAAGVDSGKGLDCNLRVQTTAAAASTQREAVDTFLTWEAADQVFLKCHILIMLREQSANLFLGNCSIQVHQDNYT